MGYTLTENCIFHKNNQPNQILLWSLHLSWKFNSFSKNDRIFDREYSMAKVNLML